LANQLSQPRKVVAMQEINHVINFAGSMFERFPPQIYATALFVLCCGLGLVGVVVSRKRSACLQEQIDELRRDGCLARIGAAAIAAWTIFGCAPSLAQNAYVPNRGDNTVSVIHTPTNSVAGLPIPVGSGPSGVVVSPDGSEVYVANFNDNTVSVIATATNSVITAIPVGGGCANNFGAIGLAESPDGRKVYVANVCSNSVSVIRAATGKVIATIPGIGEAFGIAVTPDGKKVYVTGERGGTSVLDAATDTVSAFINTESRAKAVAVSPDGSRVYITNIGVLVVDTATDTVVTQVATSTADHFGVAVSPDGTKVYVTNEQDGTVSVIDTATNTVVGLPIPVGADPNGLAVTPDGTKVYVVNGGNNTVSVIDTAISKVVAVLSVGNAPSAFGVFIQPRFAGTPGKRICKAKSTSALAETFSGLKRAAIALGFPTVEALRIAVKAYCRNDDVEDDLGAEAKRND
jgi:YVTN family beta-propeller protein